MSDDRPGPNIALGSAQAWLRERLDDGERCPCCTQFAKVYRRRINSAMARALIHQYRTCGQSYAQTTRLCPWTHEAAQLAWWGLLQEDPERRPDGGRSSWWSVTDRGVKFVTNRLMVAKYAYVYDGQLQRLDGSQQVTIEDALGKKFDYRELMRGV